MDKVQKKRTVCVQHFSVTLRLNYLKGEAWRNNVSESVFFDNREKGMDLGYNKA
jgi:hypothetical protein